MVSLTTPCQENPDLWFSDSPSDKNFAKSLCGTCPVRGSCLQLAVNNNEKFGIWGGEDFSISYTKYLEEQRKADKEAGLCKKKKHKLPEDRKNNHCKECHKEARREWSRKQRESNSDYYHRKLARERERGKKRRDRTKNKIGGTCHSGKHVLTEENTTVRSYDNKLVCKQCIKDSQKKIEAMENGNYRRRPV